MKSCRRGGHARGRCGVRARRGGRIRARRCGAPSSLSLLRGATAEAKAPQPRVVRGGLRSCLPRRRRLPRSRSARPPRAHPSAPFHRPQQASRPRSEISYAMGGCPCTRDRRCTGAATFHDRRETLALLDPPVDQRRRPPKTQGTTSSRTGPSKRQGPPRCEQARPSWRSSLRFALLSRIARRSSP
jgi:hypothetical protein